MHASIGGAASPKWRNAVGSADRILREYLLAVNRNAELRVVDPRLWRKTLPRDPGVTAIEGG
jgi:hypothetical protein